MQLFDKYLLYWPILAASVLFLILGLWWRLSAARAMELAQKPLGWVRQYRSGAFPFRSVLPQKPRLRWLALLAVVLFAALCAFGKLVNTATIWKLPPLIAFRSRYACFCLLLWTVGAAAVYLLLNALFDSPWVALPGALLFAASAAQGHGESCFLAVSLLLLLYYLRAEKSGLPAELLYAASIVALAPLLALRPALVWLILCFPPVHWYKLVFQRRNRLLSGGRLALSLLIALLGWLLSFCLAVTLLRFLLYSFRFRELLLFTNPQRFLLTARMLLRALRAQLFAVPTPGMTISLMIDAPLFGFGLWGCCSAWRLAHSRRDARGVLVLIVLAVLLALWLITGVYTLTLGLTLSTACILQDANLGKKRSLSIVLPLLGILWYVGISAAAWYFPLTPGLVQRLV